MDIRLLPMSTEEFPTMQHVLCYLMVGLKEKQEGKYYFRRKSIAYKDDVLIAFQYRNKIVATGIMIGQSDEGKVENGVVYNGYFRFDTNSIKGVSTFITSDMIKEIMPEFKGFNQSTQYLSPECISLLHPKDSGFSAEPIGFPLD